MHDCGSGAPAGAKTVHCVLPGEVEEVRAYSSARASESRCARTAGRSRRLFAGLQPAGSAAALSDLEQRPAHRASTGRMRTGSAGGSGSAAGGCAGSGTSPGRAAGSMPRPSACGTAPISASVYGCSGSRPQRLRRARLHHHAEVHDRDDVGDVPDDREVVRDQQQAQREPSREVDEEVRDLRLRGGVERGERLVEDEHRRIGRERARDRDPLPLAAAELMRVAAGRSRGQPDELEQLRDACAPARGEEDVEHIKRVGELRADLAPRVQRRVRVLEDHLQPRELARAGAPRQRRHLAPLERRRSRPRRRTSPTAARARLDLPQPDSPTRPTI